MQLQLFQKTFTRYLTSGQPFLFLIDFEKRRPYLCKLEDAEKEHVYFDVKGFTNLKSNSGFREINLVVYPVDRDIYAEKFLKVKQHIQNGDTYLLNLTFPTEININLDLKEIFQTAEAPYKLLFKNRFVLFSPESFIQVRQKNIFTFPMKGTIDAGIDNAEKILLNNRKEEWEHNTIVDLMRNDLAMIAEIITVEKYRYVEKIRTNQRNLLQTSSEIKGILKDNYADTFCKDLFKLLPAGSVSGAPKQKTVQIIRDNEIAPRGYYTGIFGIFDGNQIDSAVNIRFIEIEKGKMYFRSGGGITFNSVMEEEYSELLQKISIPLSQNGLG